VTALASTLAMQDLNRYGSNHPLPILVNFSTMARKISFCQTSFQILHPKLPIFVKLVLMKISILLLMLLSSFLAHAITADCSNKVPRVIQHQKLAEHLSEIYEVKITTKSTFTSKTGYPVLELDIGIRCTIGGLYGLARASHWPMNRYTCWDGNSYLGTFQAYHSSDWGSCKTVIEND
jgi:hypothetical protein